MGPDSFVTVTGVRASRHSIRDLEVSASAVAASAMRACDVMFHTPHDALYFS